MKIEKNVSLKPFNTFGIDVSAEYFAAVSSEEEIKDVLSDPKFINNGHLILGGGSNVLFTHNVNGLVIHNRLKGMEIVQKNDEHIYLRSASGEVWHEMVMFALNANAGGIENLSLIPGSVGAGPMQNIGAYGVELKDVFHSLDAINLEDFKTRTFSAAECKFGYRESVFKHELKNKYFITSVTLCLKVNPVLNTSYGAISKELEAMGIQSPSIKDVSEAVIRIRKSKLPDPAVLGNAGSFFKNPEVHKPVFDALQDKFPEIVGYQLENGNVKLAAGWLIEQCGWKGKRVGETGSHKDQALVLVNYGNAKGDDVKKLAMEIRQSVKEKFGVEINPEVNIY